MLLYYKQLFGTPIISDNGLRLLTKSIFQRSPFIWTTPRLLIFRLSVGPPLLLRLPSSPYYLELENIDTVYSQHTPADQFLYQKTKIAELNIKTILNSANRTKDSIFKSYYFKEIQENYQTDHSNFGMEHIDNIM